MRADLLITSALVWDGRPVPGADTIAVESGRIIAVGPTGRLQGLRDEGTEVIDVGGRRVIPGLIDSHLHMARAGRTWSQEVRWEGVTTVSGALALIGARADTLGPGRWVGVVGGWHPFQFEEGRAPTMAELDEAASSNPVLVQRNYVETFINSRAMEEMQWPDREVPGGRVTDGPRMAALRARLGAGSLAAEIASTRELLRELNRLGLTGAIDAAGFGMAPDSYSALADVLAAPSPGFRARLLVGAVTPGAEMTDIEGWMKRVSLTGGSDFLRHLGAGELLHYGAHDLEGLMPTDISGHTGALASQAEALIEAGWPAHIHAILDTSVGVVLDAWETVTSPSRLAELRYTICHADQVGAANLERIRDLGLGVTVQNGMSVRGRDSSGTWAGEQLLRAPPLKTMLQMGIPIGAGSDGTVASSHNPWRCISWMVSGRSLDGSPARDPSECLTIDEALSLYTSGSAWFSFEEANRGNLRAGSHADMVALSSDPLAIPVDEIEAVESVLTIVGGEVAHSSLGGESHRPR